MHIEAPTLAFSFTHVALIALRVHGFHMYVCTAADGTNEQLKRNWFFVGKLHFRFISSTFLAEEKCREEKRCERRLMWVHAVQSRRIHCNIEMIREQQYQQEWDTEESIDFFDVVVVNVIASRAHSSRECSTVKFIFTPKNDKPAIAVLTCGNVIFYSMHM